MFVREDSKVGQRAKPNLGILDLGRGERERGASDKTKSECRLPKKHKRRRVRLFLMQEPELVGRRNRLEWTNRQHRLARLLFRTHWLQGSSRRCATNSRIRSGVMHPIKAPAGSGLARSTPGKKTGLRCGGAGNPETAVAMQFAAVLASQALSRAFCPPAGQVTAFQSPFVFPQRASCSSAG